MTGKDLPSVNNDLERTVEGRIEGKGGSNSGSFGWFLK